MGYTAEIDANAAQAAEKAAAGGDGVYAPLPRGKYQATIANIKGVVDFANSGANAGKKALNIGFRIIDGSPTGAGRYVWARIPLFSRFAPTQDHPEGAPAKAYWDFWEKAIGLPRDVVISGKLPDNIGGRQITITLGALTPPDERNPLGSNEIAFYDAAGDVNLTPTGAPQAPWLDQNGKLLPEWAAKAGTPAPAQGSQAALAAAVPAAQLWGQPAAAPAAPAAATNPWGQPVDPQQQALLAAAASQQGGAI